MIKDLNTLKYCQLLRIVTLV